MYDRPLVAAAEPEVAIAVVDSSSFFLEEDAAAAAATAAAAAAAAPAPAKAARDPALLSGRTPLPPTEQLLKHKPAASLDAAAATGKAELSVVYVCQIVFPRARTRAVIAVVATNFNPNPRALALCSRACCC